MLLADAIRADEFNDVVVIRDLRTVILWVCEDVGKSHDYYVCLINHEAIQDLIIETVLALEAMWRIYYDGNDRDAMRGVLDIRSSFTMGIKSFIQFHQQ